MTYIGHACVAHEPPDPCDPPTPAQLDEDVRDLDQYNKEFWTCLCKQ